MNHWVFRLQAFCAPGAAPDRSGAVYPVIFVGENHGCAGCLLRSVRVKDPGIQLEGLTQHRVLPVLPANFGDFSNIAVEFVCDLGKVARLTTLADG